MSALNFASSLASAYNAGGVDLKQVFILVFVLCVLVALGWMAKKIPAELWFMQWLVWFVLFVVSVVMVYRFLQSM